MGTESKMKIILTGTGTSQGVPVIGCPCRVCASADSRDKRLRTSAYLELGGQRWVIDSGPDFRQQMLRHDIRRLDAILFTHDHKDHIAGLDDVRSYNYLQKSPMDIYAEPYVVKSLKKVYSYAFLPPEKKYPGVPELSVQTIGNEAFSINGIDITPIRAWHLKLPILGFRIGGFIYITDANHIPDEEMPKLAGAKVLVINALRKEKHISHYNLEEALAVIGQAKPEKAYLTHISHLMGLHAELHRELPPNVHAGYDGLEIDL
jgi:phosphoribosyl 1,2-cyclic phosphate phosphodiesterase